MSTPALLFPLPVRQTTGKIPLTSEIKVSPGLGDCLVSLTKSFAWVSPRSDGSVRSAYQARSIAQVELGVLREVYHTGRQFDWGSVFGPGDVNGAIGHLRYFDISEVDVLSFDGSNHSVCVPWLPPQLVVVVPKDRALLGASSTIGGRSAVIVHNAPRAVAFCAPETFEFPP